MRVLVTGGAGYIGSHMVKMLLERGHECVVLDTLERGWRDAVDSRAELVVGSVGDRDAVRAAVIGCDAVMHLAGYVEVAESMVEPERYHRNNATEPVVLLEEMVNAGVASIVFSSTAAVYGEPQSIPIVETDPTRPLNPYGASKLAFEERINDFAERGLHSVIFRYFNVAGAWPGGEIGEAHDPETHLIPRILRHIQEGGHKFEIFGSDFPTRDGTCVRDYIHVCDLANAHVIALERLADGYEGGVFNLGNGAGFTNLEVVRACGEVTGFEVDIEDGPRRMGDPAVLVASSQRAREELGWKADRPALNEIIHDAWAWHLARPNGYR